MAPKLADYEYQFKDLGVLLNGDAVLPFYDVEKVTGLTGFPALVYDVAEYDGAHGGSVQGQFFSHRVVIFEGTMYSKAGEVDHHLEDLRRTLIPDNVAYPLHWKHPGLDQRYIDCKAVGFQSDIDTTRGLGHVPFQITLIAEDPRHYIDNADKAVTVGVSFSVTNSGNVESFPKIKLVGTVSSVTVNCTTEGRSVTFSGIGATSGQTTLIDTALRSLTVAGVDKSGTFSSGSWPTLPVGISSWTISTTGGTPTTTFLSRSAFQ